MHIVPPTATLLTIIATTTIIQPTHADCISGGIVYTEGEATGTHLGLECIKWSEYNDNGCQWIVIVSNGVLFRNE